MTWQVEIEILLRTGEPTGVYYVSNPAESLPIDIDFKSKKDAKKFADWLNKKETWIERLELIAKYEANVEIDKLKEKHFL